MLLYALLWSVVLDDALVFGMGVNVFIFEVIVFGTAIGTAVTAPLRGTVTKLGGFIFLWCAYTFLSGMLLYSPAWSALGTFYVLKAPIALAAGFSLVDRWSYLHRVGRVVVFASVTTALVSLTSQVVDLSPVYGALNYNFIRTGASGIFTNPNKNGIFCLVGILAAYGFVGGRFRHGIGALLGAAILLSGSRQALLGLMIFGLLMAWTPNGIIRRRRPLAIIGALAVLVGLSLSAGNLVYERTLQDVARVPQDGAFRLIATRAALDVMSTSPLLGVGAGGFGGPVAQLSGSPYQTELFSYYHSVGGRALTTDVFWAHFAAETGLLGLLFYGTFLAWIVRALSKSWRDDPYAVALVGSTLSSALIGFFSFSLEASFIEVFMFVLLGGYLRLQSMNRAQASVTRPRWPTSCPPELTAPA